MQLDVTGGTLAYEVTGSVRWLCSPTAWATAARLTGS